MATRSAVGFLALLATFAAALGGCSSGGRRDQFYGTDVGSTYRPSEAGVPIAPDAGGQRPDADAARDGADARPDAGADGPRG
jgi:hypothetical protein